MITEFKEHIFVKDRITLLRLVLYLELVIKKDISLSDNELSILSLFEAENSKELVIQQGIERNFIKSKQSGENIVSRLVKLNLLDKVGTNKRAVSKTIFNVKLNQLIYSTFSIHNLDASKN